MTILLLVGGIAGVLVWHFTSKPTKSTIVEPIIPSLGGTWCCRCAQFLTTSRLQWWYAWHRGRTDRDCCIDAASDGGRLAGSTSHDISAGAALDDIDPSAYSSSSHACHVLDFFGKIVAQYELPSCSASTVMKTPLSNFDIDTHADALAANGIPGGEHQTKGELTCSSSARTGKLWRSERLKLQAQARNDHLRSASEGEVPLDVGASLSIADDRPVND